MKIRILYLASFILINYFARAQSDVVAFLDIPGIEGEYLTPTNRLKFTTNSPKARNILLSNYESQGAAESSFGKGSGPSVGKPTDFEYMTFSFQVDKSIISLYENLANKTVIPFMDVFIDKPAVNGFQQTEVSRIRLENVVIIKLGTFIAEIPQYTLRVKFDKISRIIHNFNPLGVGSKGTPYCFDKKNMTNESCFTF
jgi:hypothetical protein